jgi:3-phosphoshikimate 1-carboxyvinyltransferase
MNLTIRAGQPLHGQVRVPGDKSIAHRAVLLATLADGPSQVRNFPPASDPLATVEAVRQLGVTVEGVQREVSTNTPSALTLTVQGRGLDGLRAPRQTIDCRNAGTTMRLLAGMLAGQPFASTLDGSAQLRRRPMRRVTEPLTRMGAHIADTDGHAPLTVTGRPLRGMRYDLPVASAQVKSALILAALFAEGRTVIREPGPARDHTERMLRAMGADVQTDGPLIRVQPSKGQARRLSPPNLSLPGDFSSAAFLIVAGSLLPGSELVITDVGVNPTRTGLLDALAAMGAEVSRQNERETNGEPVADLRVRSAGLKGTTVSGDTVVRMIDEFPILAVAATQAQGTTVVRDAAELRLKESDRIARLAEGLSKLGAQIEGRPDGFIIEGPTRLRGAVVDSHGDHRLAMALAVAGLVAEGETVVRGAEAIADSFPGFETALSASGALLFPGASSLSENPVA